MSRAEFRYRMFIDESGNHHVTDDALKSEANHHLCLLASMLEMSSEEPELVEKMNRIKRMYFPRCHENVVFHREDILKRKPPFDILTQEHLGKNFDAAMLDLYQTANYHLLAVVFDKPSHKKRYGSAMWHPYHYCLEILIDRYVKFLRRRNAVGDVYAEVRGTKEDRLLKKSWDDLRTSGSRYTTRGEMNQRLTSRDISLKPKSANVCGLQLSDLLVTNVGRGILVENEVREMFRDPFGRKVCKAVKDKFDGPASWSRIYLRAD